MAGMRPVVGEQYVTPTPTQLTVARKVVNISGGDFAITDSEGQPYFKLKGSHVSLHDKRTLYDTTDSPVLTLHKKLISLHDTWEAYRGETNEAIFSVKKSQMSDRGGLSYDVVLEGGSEPDYVVKGDFGRRNYSVVYHNENIVAEVGKKLFRLSSLFGGKNKYGVKVHAGVDQALIAAIVVIIDSIHQEEKDNKGEGSSSSDSD